VPEIPKLSVVTPAYNEMATIEEILWRVQAIAIDKEIIVIDDGSKDGARDFLTQLQNHIAAVTGSGSLAPFGRLSKVDHIRVIFQEQNCGKGAAFILLALSGWLPKDRRLVWGLAVAPPALAVHSEIGIKNVAEIVRRAMV
jgi:cellulose synthase/poly-beta-1,6-N-acetylglucosamine synthase-like glycosyltransferase